jgi:glycosyltransferase involved in cell wall biosynthesis
MAYRKFRGMDVPLWRDCRVNRRSGPLRVLYIHHAGVPTGAGRSLLDLIDNLPRDAVLPHVLAPAGAFVDELAARGIPSVVVRGVAQLDDTAWGHYRGTRWLVLLRELSLLPATVSGLREARRRWPAIDLVHVNEITPLPALIFARRLFDVPAVVHVRSMQRRDTSNRWSRWLQRVLRKHASALVAIDETVRRTLPDNVDVRVIRNSFSSRPSTQGDAFAERVRLLGGTSLKVAMVGSLLRLKGVFEFVEAAALCRDRGVNATFFFVGDDIRHLDSVRGRVLSTLGIAENVAAALRQRISTLGLDDQVHLLGFTPDIASVYQAIDVLCFASHLDAPGRPVFEAALFGVPSIVAVREPTIDCFRPSETGVGVDAPTPERIANAVALLAESPSRRRAMGDAARTWVTRMHDGDQNARSMLALYRSLLL